MCQREPSHFPQVEKTRVAVGGSAGSPLVQTASVFTVSSAASAGSAGVLSSATATPTTQASTAAAAASSSSGGGSAAKVDLFGGLENDPFGNNMHGDGGRRLVKVIR